MPLNPDPRYRFPYALLLILLQLGGFVVLIERASSLRVGYRGFDFAQKHSRGLTWIVL
ncbi:hypothetical protein [Gordonia sp. CPCC 205515]|uniref:hypothetical protein n=1 Tax=Gordonia sp. CPCC 205515 TaxID=3140791 RepID=UPI003AF38908